MSDENPGQRREVPAEVAALIERNGPLFRAAIERGDFDAADALAHVDWDAIPDPKDQWEFYPQVLPRSTAEVFVRAGQLERAIAWMKIARPGSVQIGQDPALDLVDARVRLAQGDRENAERIANTLFEQFGASIFAGDDRDLLPLASAYQARVGKGISTELSAQVSPADQPADFPMASGGATEAPNDLDDQLEIIGEAGSVAMDNDDWQLAVTEWTKGLELIPAPRMESEAATWFYTVLGDAYYYGDQLELAHRSLREGLKCPGAFGSGFLWLRLGQVRADLGDLPGAQEALVSAYLLEGEEIFDDEDQRYLQLVAERIELA